MNVLETLNELTEVRESTIHGLGLFAKKDISKGKIWWKGAIGLNILLLNELQYKTYKASEKNTITDTLWELFTKYAYYSKELDSLVLCLDNARYVNHAAEPNSGATIDFDPLISIALKDIMEGEEILENYNNYEDCSWLDILKFDNK